MLTHPAASVYNPPLTAELTRQLAGRHDRRGLPEQILLKRRLLDEIPGAGRRRKATATGIFVFQEQHNG
jgi:hypothetical protein